jgi:hypothetical protein
MFCSGCGKESADEFNFCPRCGRDLFKASSVTESPNPLPEVFPLPASQREHSASTEFSSSNRADEIGTYVFGTFSAISLVVSLIKGIVPSYLLECLGWAGAAWYWHRSKPHRELARGLVLAFAALIAAGEVVQIVAHTNSSLGSQSRRAPILAPQNGDNTSGSYYRPNGQVQMTAPTGTPASIGDQDLRPTNQSPRVTHDSLSPSTILVICDLACDWKLDAKPHGHIMAGNSSSAGVSLGQHLVEATSTDE